MPLPNKLQPGVCMENFNIIIISNPKCHNEPQHNNSYKARICQNKILTMLERNQKPVSYYNGVPVSTIYEWCCLIQLATISMWGEPPCSSSRVLDRRSLSPMFKSRRGYIWRLFHLWLNFITCGGQLAHLAYHVHKSGSKTSIIIIIIIITMSMQNSLG